MAFIPIDEACRVMAETQIGVQVTDAEVADLVAFMNALTGEFPEITLPRLSVRSGETVIDKTEATTDENK